METNTGRCSPSSNAIATLICDQVFIVIFFWLWRIVKGNSGPPRLLWLSRANRFLRTSYLPRSQRRIHGIHVQNALHRGRLSSALLQPSMLFETSTRSSVSNVCVSCSQYAPSEIPLQPPNLSRILSVSSFFALQSLINSLVLSLVLPRYMDNDWLRRRFCDGHVHSSEMASRYLFNGVCWLLHSLSQ